MNYGDVFWVDLPDANGHEQSGRRPAIIFQDTTLPLPTVFVIPMTTQTSSLRFAGTVLIQPTATNGLYAPSVALVFQMRACDVTPIDEHALGHLDDPDLQAVQAMAKRLMQLP